MKQRSCKRHLLGFLTIALFFSCEEQTDWVFKSDGNGALVVEAIITDELKQQEVLLSVSSDDLNGEPLPVENASVRLSGGGESVDFQPDASQPGRYLSRRLFSARLATSYQLEINWQGTTYTAANTMAPVRPFTRPNFVPVGGGDSLRLGEVAPLYSPDEEALYEIDLDWSHLVNAGPARAKLFFYTLRTVDVSELFRPPEEKVVFPRGSKVVIKKYSMNPAFAAYIRALLLATKWQGGIFDEDPAGLPTNLNNGALGFFAVCAVRSETFVAQ